MIPLPPARHFSSSSMFLSTFLGLRTPLKTFLEPPPLHKPADFDPPQKMAPYGPENTDFARRGEGALAASAKALIENSQSLNGFVQ